MNSTQISCFLKVAECGSFTRAAELLFLSQPALSKNIRALESEIGTQLLERRSSQRVHLTSAGKVIYDCLKSSSDRLKEATDTARMLGSGCTGQLKIGLLSGQFLDERVRSLLRTFKRTHPEIRVDLYRGSFSSLTSQLLEGSLDAIVTIDPDVAKIGTLEKLPLYELPTLLLVPKERARRTWLHTHLSSFADLPFLCISHDDSSIVYGMLTELCSKAGFAPILRTVPDLESLVLQLDLGLGVTLLNQNHMAAHSPHVACMPLPELKPMQFDLCLSRSSSNPCLDAFRSVCMLTGHQGGPDTPAWCA